VKKGKRDREKEGIIEEKRDEKKGERGICEQRKVKGEAERDKEREKQRKGERHGEGGSSCGERNHTFLLPFLSHSPPAIINKCLHHLLVLNIFKPAYSKYC